MFFHGTPYSPKEAEWPGWLFYASINMSPTNSIWRDAPSFFNYITRCQSFLQMGRPDNDFLIYLPVYDMWNEQPGRLLLFTINWLLSLSTLSIASTTAGMTGIIFPITLFAVHVSKTDSWLLQAERATKHW